MSASPQLYVTLNNGGKMPTIGLGCASGVTIEEHEAARPWILSALKLGYRHLVSTERKALLGKLLTRNKSTSNIVTTITAFTRATFPSQWLIHWPQAVANIKDNPLPHYPGQNGEPNQGDYIVNDKIHISQTWAEMEKVYESGKVKAIGVANFSVKKCSEEAFGDGQIIPAVNQVEMHPHQAQAELLEFSNDPTIVKLAERYRVSPAQISLAWHASKGTVAIPKSANEARQRANLFAPAIQELPTLLKEEIESINTLHKDVYYLSLEGPKVRNKHESVFG